MLFDIQRRIADGREVVSVVGDVDLASLPELATALMASTGDVVVDLSGVDYVDPVCLGALIAMDLRVRRGGGHLTVRASSGVGSLLEESRLNEILDVEAPPA